MAKELMYEEVYHAILQWIRDGKYRVGDLLPTENELTKQFFVSRITVRKALQMLADDGAVHRVAGRGTYVSDAGGLRKTGRKKLIGVILANAEHSFGAELLLSIERHAQEAGYTILFRNSHDSIESERKAIEEFLDLGAAGLLIQPIRAEYYNDLIIKLHMQSFPLVLIDRDMPGFPISCVSTDNFKASADVTKLAFSKGHENITFFCLAPKDINTLNDRISGFRSVFYDNEKLLTSSNIFADIRFPWFNAEDVARIKRFLTANPQITCLFASEYVVAEMLLTAVAELGKSIPEDYSAMAFDNVSSLPGPALCTVKQDEFAIGKTAVRTLVHILLNGQTCNKVYIPYRILEGCSLKRNDRPRLKVEMPTK